jgi:hypothetical protein
VIRHRTWVIAVVLAAAACDSTGAYVYYAREYDDQRDCLKQVEALDVISGTDPGFGCQNRCISVKDVDGSILLYGTTQCGAPPPLSNSTEADPRCPAVRAAVAATNLCKPDSGIKEAGLDAPIESGVDLDAGADSSSDAGVE